MRNINSISLAVFQNGNLVSGSYDKTIKIWSNSDWSLINTLTGHSFWVILLAVFWQNGNLASGSGDATIKIWNVNAGVLVATLTGHSNFVFS